MSAPFIPDNAPFSAEQRAWLNGFLAGMFSRSGTGIPACAPSPAQALTPLTILWGSQTGTAEGLAKQAAKEAGKRGFAPTVMDMAAATAEQIAAAGNVLVITSTYGEGEPPDNAKALHDALLNGAPSLSGVRYSVCGLGDTNYTLFNQCAKNFDSALAKHGGARVHDRADCDTDYEEPFTVWLDKSLAAFGSTSVVGADLGQPAPSTETPAFGKKNPFPSPLLTVRNLNAPGSAKEVNHVEFSLEGSGLVYEAGDALAVIPQNCPDLVDAVLTALGSDGEEAVTTPAGELPLRLALTAHFDLGKPAKALLDLLGSGTGIPACAPHDVLDALNAATAKPAPAAFAAALRKIAPRLYSISSSPKAHPGQVHLTVGAVRYDLLGRSRKGVCSTFLAERAMASGTVGVFVHSNKAFRPPSDPSVPMIMVGPGTGIAPFRAFLQERAATQATGKNWLFFGDQKATTDFLYREELEALQTAGQLARLDLAFSRDQVEKIYVQNRMTEAAAELWSWLEQGAHFYVCGDASRMAKDVDAALHKVIETAGGKSPEEAIAYVQALRTAKRYQRDVY